MATSEDFDIAVISDELVISRLKQYICEPCNVKPEVLPVLNKIDGVIVTRFRSNMGQYSITLSYSN